MEALKAKGLEFNSYEGLIGGMSKDAMIIDDINHYETEKLIELLRPDIFCAGIKEKYIIEKMGLPLKQLHNYDMGGPYAGFKGAINWYNGHRPHGEHQGLGSDQGALAVHRPRARSQLRGGITNVFREKGTHYGSPQTYHRRDQGTLRAHRQPGQDLPACRCHVRGARCPRLFSPQSRFPGLLRLPPLRPDRHYKEPVVAGTSSFTEGSSVFGGQSNLITAIENIFTLYDPSVIAIHTTCLSETIGDDLMQISQKARDDGKVPGGKHIVYASTPSYVGTHVTGYANMVKGILKGFAAKSGTPNGKVNIIPGFCEPSDMAEFRRIAAMMGIEIIMVPDTNGVLNGPLTGHYEMYPKGGATVEEITSMGDSIGSIGLGRWATTDAVNYLDSEYKVPGKVLSLPIGLKATDRFVNELRLLSGKAVPESINFERGQVVDIISDYSQYFYGKKVAIAGDPDQVLALVEFVVTPGHDSGLHGERHGREVLRRAHGGAGEKRALRLQVQVRSPRPTCTCCTSGSRTIRSTCSLATRTSSTLPGTRTFR